MLQNFKTRVINTQSNALGGTLNIRYTVPAGNILEISSLILGSDNYALDKSIQARNWDSSALMATLINKSTINNKILRLIASVHGGTAVVDIENIVGASKLPFKLLPGQRLIISAGSLAQNETLTLTIEGKCKILPLFTKIGSGGTAAISTIYNKTV